MKNTKSETQKVGFGFINRITASSITTMFKSLSKSDVYDDEELNKEDRAFLENIVLEEDRKLKAKLYGNKTNSISQRYNGNLKKTKKEEVNRNLVVEENVKEH